MKRSQFVDFPRFRKNKMWRLAPLSLAVATVMYGCSRSEDVVFVKDVDDCVSKTQMDKPSCELAYRKAVAEAEQTSPRYDTRKLCETEFYGQGCHKASGGFFMPLMSGFLVGAALSRYNSNNYYHPIYTYYSGSGPKRVLSDGTALPKGRGTRYTLSKGLMNRPQPKSIVTKTISRGGFGSKASAKASWGSSSRSSLGG